VDTHEEVFHVDNNAEQAVQLLAADLLQVGHVAPQRVIARPRHSTVVHCR